MNIDLIIIITIAVFALLGILIGINTLPKFAIYLPISFSIASLAGLLFFKFMNKQSWFTDGTKLILNQSAISKIGYVAVVAVGTFIVAILIRLLVKLLASLLKMNAFTSHCGAGILLGISGALLAIGICTTLLVFNIEIQPNVITQFLTKIVTF